jgi:hypothetical protein
LAERGADPGRVAEGRFVYGFSLLWADQVEEAAEVLARAVEETTRLGTVTEGCRAKVYRAIALRRLGAVDAAEEAAIEAREAAAAIDSEYYTGHALAVLCWAAWKRGDEDADRIGEEAYRAWGVFERDGDRGLDTEFAWLAVWPRAEDAFDREDFAAAVDHLRHVLVSWERPMPAGLAEVVRRAVESGDPELLAESIRGAEAAGLL